jgi:hypothetical protein
MAEKLLNTINQIIIDSNLLSIMIWFMVFNNISAISWRLVLLVEETGVPGENHRPAASQEQILRFPISI